MRSPTLVIACLAVALVPASRAPAQTAVSTFASNAQHTANYSAAAQQPDAKRESSAASKLSGPVHSPIGVLRNPQVSSAIHFDVSPPLREMAAEVSPESGEEELETPVLHPKLRLLQEAARSRAPREDGALQTYVAPLVSAPIGLNLLGVGKGFPNYSIPDAPTDVNLAVGDTQVLQWVNVSYAVFNKTTGALITGPIKGNQLWSGFGGPCQSYNSGDIIAQWDKLAHVWVLTQNVFTSPYMTCVAVSTTSDATGTYYRFAFPQSAGFPDYPKWGVWPDAYYQSQNLFDSTGETYYGAYACAYDRTKMLVGDSTAEQICFQTGTLDDSLLPGDLDSAGTLPPTGQPEVYLGSIDDGTADVYEYLFHVDFVTPSNSTFTGVGETMPVPGVSPFTVGLCSGSNPFACVPQEGTSVLVDTIGDRLMYRLAYRNFGGDHQSWLVSHTVIAGSSMGERWYEFRAPENSTSLSVYQQGTYAPDNNYRWMGSIAMDQSEDILLGYSISSSSMYPSINYTGQAAGDPLGTMEAEATIVSGTGSQTSTANRWGDYTSVALDEADDCTFWYTNQYYMATGSFAWSTQLASFKFPSCGSTSNQTTTTVTSTPNPSSFGQSVTFTSTTSSSAGVPVGTVTFMQGNNILASNVAVNGSGQAAFSTSALAVDSNIITANFTGSTGWTNNSGSDSASPQVVSKDATTTAVSSSANPSVYSQSVTFTAVVTAKAPGSGVPSGTVTFKNGSTTLGTSTLDGTGTATFTTSTLTVAAHSITATYGGSSSFSTSVSSTLTQTVNKDSTTSSVTSSLNPSNPGQSVTFTATVVANAPGTAVPTGTVTFKDGTTTLGTGTLSSGVATFSTSTLSVGNHSITAVYGASSSFLGSTSPVLVQTVN
ncbi:MAG: Ig-like domain-containing protein [Candidatus Sulfotelmatobacter sp.]